MKKLKYLLLILPFLFISNVKADLVNWKFAGFQSTDDHIKSTYYNANETNVYGPNSFVFNTTGEFFVKVTTCSTGNFAINSVTNIEGITFYSGRYQGSKCNVQGYEGYIQEYYFTAKQTTDAGNGNSGVIFKVSVTSVNYYSVTDFLGVYIADTIPQQIVLPNYSAEFGEVNYRIGQVETSQQQILEKQQAIISEQQNTTNAVNKLDDTLKDDNVNISESSITDNSASVSDSPISDLLILPIKLLNNISNGIQGACTTFNLGNLFGTEIILPCINLESILGSFLWGLIDSLFCIFLIYNVCMLAIKIWTDVIMMEDVFRDLYKPSSEKKGGGKK